MLERIIHFSIRHRLLVILLTGVAATIGVFSLIALPIDAVPDITNNQVQINTVYPAFSPNEIEKQITLPVETALAGIPGLEYTRSLSRNGFSQVTAVFENSVDIYFARQQVLERIGDAKELLPPGAEPKMGPISTGLGEVFMWTIDYEHPAGKGLTEFAEEGGWQKDGSYLTPEGALLRTGFEQAAYLRELQDWVVRPQLRGLKGVAGIDSIGGYEKHYVVEPDLLKLVSLNLSFSNVLEALERNSQSSGAGYIEHGGESFIVRSSGLINRMEEISDIVIGEQHGIPIKIRDIGEVKLGKELRTGSASLNGQEVVVGTALMLIGANSRTTAKTVGEKLIEISRTLPADIHITPVLDRTSLVDATIRTVEKNLFEGALLVVAVLFFLLGNARAAIITALAIPLSMLLTASGMLHARVSGNLMSLGAVDFGLIVDGAVIIVENCIRRLAEKQHELKRRLSSEERMVELIDATSEVLQPSVFGQAIIIIVYVPILFLTGIEGKMFQPMAITVIFALMAAFVLSITFIPAMIALCLGGDIREKENIFLRAAKRSYAPLLAASLRWRRSVVAAALASMAFAGLLFLSLGQEFAPTLDEQDLAVHALRLPSTSLTQAQTMQLVLERTLSQVPEVRLVFSKTGTAEVASDPMPPNVSDTFVILKAKHDWPNPNDSKDELIKRIQTLVQTLPGNNYEFTQPIQMRFNELIAGVRGDVAVKIFGDDYEKLLPAANKIAAAFRSIHGAEGVKVEQVTGLPLLDIDIDSKAASRFGLDVRDVQDVISTAIAGTEAGFVFEGDRRFDLVVRLPEALRSNLETLRRLPIPIGEHPEEKDEIGTLESFSTQAKFVTLETIAKLNVVEGPNQISRENGKRRIVIQANVRGRDLGSFVDEAQAALANLELPTGYWLSWGGQFENLVAAKRRLLVVVPVCFLMIFLLLFSTFNSVRLSLVVFSGVPLALSGGVVALWLRGMPFSISAAVGFIALSGVAVLNGVVMVSFINHLRERGRKLEQAIEEGAITRLRPILMTALVASLGFVPMAIATGTGAEVQRPIATVVIGGLLSATLLTLFVLPALYRMFARNDAEQ